ncbi:DUF3152 domain-containing protein [Streptomyces sp. S186]|uniref:DUF3152 domain-containing protein n=1 Tax=Streptomyces sp. S186 TaxID=3434395 RepID=UPI003F665C2E
MGRHSRRGERSRPAPETAETTGSTPHTPGTGRRRRVTGPPEGGAAVRGGHPEQREPGGAWGAVPPPGGPAAPAPRVPRPRAAEPGGPASGTPPFGTPIDTPAAGTPAFGTPAFGVPVVSPADDPGPRPEYLEAFDGGGSGSGGGKGNEPGAGADRSAARGTEDAASPAGAPDGGAAGFPDGVSGGAFAAQAVRPAGGADGSAGGAGEPAGGRGAAGPGPRGARKGHRARTLTGAAAAAVTTALAAVIAGQVADQRRDDGGPQARSGDDRSDGGTDQASRSQTRGGRDAKPADYATRMAEVFPLDPQLTAGGSFRPVGGDAAAPGHGTVVRYRVDVEEGLPLDGALFAEAVHKTLNDDRSWAHGGRRTFQRVGSGAADFVISLASPGTTAKWCAKSGLDTTEDNVSCDSALTKRVMINAYRWAQGAATYGPDRMLAYRQMLINHEVGHRLGHNHEGCSRQGALAPVMMQQTKFLTTDGVTCRPNSWPYPTGH